MKDMPRSVRMTDKSEYVASSRRSLALVGPEATASASANGQGTCGCGFGTSGSTKTCAATGDPHFKTYKGKYDFMGLGVYEYASVNLPGCGCSLKVNVFLAPNAKHGGASSTIAVAMSFGGQTVTILPTLATSGGISCEDVSQTAKGKTVRGKKCDIPGGGDLTVYQFPMPAMPENNILSLWLTLPVGTTSSVSGLCGSTMCKDKMPPLPNSIISKLHTVSADTNTFKAGLEPGEARLRRSDWRSSRDDRAWASPNALV